MSKSTVILFYANWCGHCQKFKPEWEKFKQQYGKEIKCEEHEDASMDRNLMKKYGVQGYPTIIIIINGETREYQGQRTADGIYAYIKKQTGETSATATKSVESSNDNIFKKKKIILSY